MAQAAQIGVAAVLVLAVLCAAAYARKAMLEARAAREDIRRLQGALEVLALLVVQRFEASPAATPVDVNPVEPGNEDAGHEECPDE